MDELIALLRDLIRIPSFSREESAAADCLQAWMTAHGLSPFREGNNLWCVAGETAPDGRLLPSEKPTLLLNAHLDTVRPSTGYTRDPFRADLEGDRLFGLGSNDDGGSLIALLQAFRILSAKPQPYRLVFSATAEEEVCGRAGLEAIFPFLGEIALGIMGEPTRMQMAVAERGLMVLDCEALGKSGHAARNEGENAIYKALPDIEWFRTYCFPAVSDFLGQVKMTVTQIEAGYQHNVIPDRCRFVVDVRSNGLYSNVELLSQIREAVSCRVQERSTRLSGASIPADHPVVVRGRSLGLESFGSPTTSNQSVSPFTTLKIGPGDSARSHAPDEYIRLSEIREGIDIFVRLLDQLSIETAS